MRHSNSIEQPAYHGSSGQPFLTNSASQDHTTMEPDFLPPPDNDLGLDWYRPRPDNDLGLDWYQPYPTDSVPQHAMGPAFPAGGSSRSEWVTSEAMRQQQQQQYYPVSPQLPNQARSLQLLNPARDLSGVLGGNYYGSPFFRGRM